MEPLLGEVNLGTVDWILAHTPPSRRGEHLEKCLIAKFTMCCVGNHHHRSYLGFLFPIQHIKNIPS